MSLSTWQEGRRLWVHTLLSSNIGSAGDKLPLCLALSSRQKRGAVKDRTVTYNSMPLNVQLLVKTCVMIVVQMNRYDCKIPHGNQVIIRVHLHCGQLRACEISHNKLYGRFGLTYNNTHGVNYVCLIYERCQLCTSDMASISLNIMDCNVHSTLMVNSSAYQLESARLR